jgi:hypothetical protein
MFWRSTIVSLLRAGSHRFNLMGSVAKINVMMEGTT